MSLGTLSSLPLHLLSHKINQMTSAAESTAPWEEMYRCHSAQYLPNISARGCLLVERCNVKALALHSSIFPLKQNKTKHFNLEKSSVLHDQTKRKKQDSRMFFPFFPSFLTRSCYVARAGLLLRSSHPSFQRTFSSAYKIQALNTHRARTAC